MRELIDRADTLAFIRLLFTEIKADMRGPRISEDELDAFMRRLEAAIKAAPTIVTVNELFTRCKHYPKNPNRTGCELLTSRICEFKGRCSFYTPAEENPAPQGLPEKLRSARKECGLSIEQLGERIGISRQRIGKWESGDGRPSPENLEKLAAIFGVSVEYLTA